MGSGTAACYRWTLTWVGATAARRNERSGRCERVVSGSDSGAALGEQRRPALDDIAQATINERLSDQRPRDIACEARHLGHLSVGQLPVTAFGRPQNRLPHRRCNETSLTRAVRGLEPPVDREQNLPGLDLVGDRSAKSPVG